MAEEEMETGSESDMDAAPPMHPVPTMQGAFEESMQETMNDEEPEVPDRYSKADSVTRRKMLLEQQEYERTVAGRWKQKPGERFHPLWKLVAQISFGMHLLQQGLAKSDEEVLKILQTHVDEVDGFLERTTEDFDLAQGDVAERIRYLKLPLEHGQVFDQMLANRDFRVAIVEGNEKIEHIIDRTAAAMNDALKDVQKGLDATRELAKYMTRVDKQWEDRTEEHDSVYLAMIGNTEGWTRAFLTLQSKGGHLRKALNQLGSIVAEMQRRAGAASRKNLVPSRSISGRYHVDVRSDSPQSSATPPRSPMKPLPTAPDPVARVASSQKYIKTSVSQSPLHSPYLNQSTTRSTKHAERMDAMSQSRSPNLTRPTRSPEPMRTARSPNPYLSTKSSQTLRPTRSPEATRSAASSESRTSPQIPETAMRVRSPDMARAKADIGTVRRVKSPEPQRIVKSPETARSAPSPVLEHYRSESEQPEIAVKGADTRPQFKAPAQITSSMKEASKGSSSGQNLSRRRSITERTRSLLRMKEDPIDREGDEKAVSSTDLPIQNHSGVGLPAKSPSSPLLRRFSSRKAKTLSMSTYSTSPTSSFKPSETPPLREESPVYLRNGKPVPAQSSYGNLSLPSLAPMAPLSPLEDPSVSLGKEKNSSFDLPSKSNAASVAPILKHKAALDDSEGNVNTNHPLLQKARHTRFARNASGDLPLRHYSSQGALTQSNPDLLQRISEDRSDDLIPPKRSSSLLHVARQRFVAPPKSRQSMSRSPTPNQTLQNLSAASLIAQAQSHAAPPESELGIHPAHRTPEPPSDSTAPVPTPSPDPSAISSTISSAHEQGVSATPPPIAIKRSDAEPPTVKPSRSVTFPTSESQNEPQTQDHWQPHHKQVSSASSNPLVSHDPQFKTTATNNTPFYLNPTSSTALMEFLASTPPPSPPHPGNRVDSPSSNTQSFLNNRSYTASPPPPGPGSRSMTNLGTVVHGEGEEEAVKKKGWKKVFGGTIKGHKRMDREKSGKKKTDMPKGRWGRDPVAVASTHGNGTANGGGSGGGGGTGSAGKGGDEGFMGMGKDGVWISRKNFLKT